MDETQEACPIFTPAQVRTGVDGSLHGLSEHIRSRKRQNAFEKSHEGHLMPRQVGLTAPNAPVWIRKDGVSDLCEP
jgi:hypothetical protein